MFQAHLINVKTLNINELLASLSYILEYCLQYLMHPFHIENWVIIMDLKKMGLMSLPLGVITFPFLKTHNY